MSPVEVFASRIKISDGIPSEALDCLIFSVLKVKLQLLILELLIFAVER